MQGYEVPNGKVFRAALREYAVRKPVDIKFKLNEKIKVSVHCKYECGWRVYASQIAGELTFQIKTMVPTCTCGGHSSIVRSLLHMWLGNIWMISTKTLIGQFLV